MERALSTGKITSERLITFNGKTQSIKKWSKELNFPYYIFKSRMNNPNYTTERAFTEPINMNKSRKSKSSSNNQGKTMWTCLRDETRKARLIHICYFCGEKIYIDEIYVYRVGVDDDNFITMKAHQVCESRTREWDECLFESFNGPCKNFLEIYKEN
jgi:hypothetical protein